MNSDFKELLQAFAKNEVRIDLNPPMFGTRLSGQRHAPKALFIGGEGTALAHGSWGTKKSYLR